MFKLGIYNPKAKYHTKEVKKEGERLMNTPVIKNWKNNKYSIGGYTELSIDPSIAPLRLSQNYLDALPSVVYNPERQSDRLVEQKIFTPEEIKKINKPVAKEQPVLKTQDRSDEALLASHDSNPLAETKFGRWWDEVAAPVMYWVPGVGEGMMTADIKNSFENKEVAEGLLNAGFLVTPYFKNAKGLAKRTLKHIDDEMFRFSNEYRERMNKALTRPATAKDIAGQVKNRLEELHKDIVTQNQIKYLMEGDIKKHFPNWTDELEKIYNHSPEYLYWSAEHKLDPLNKETVNKFLNMQSRSYRGVFDTDPNIVNTALSTAYRERQPWQTGGDYFRINGLYTSNSNEAKEKFAKNYKKESLWGDTGTLTVDFNIDKNKSVLEQLKQFKNQIYFNDVYEPAFDIRKKYKAIQGNYFGNQQQRAYGTLKDAETIGKISDIEHHNSNGIRTDRWSNIPSVIDDNVFVSQQPGIDFETILRYSRDSDLRNQIGKPNLPVEFRKNIENRINKYNELWDNVINRQRTIIPGLEDYERRKIIKFENFFENFDETKLLDVEKLTREEKNIIKDIIEMRNYPDKDISKYLDEVDKILYDKIGIGLEEIKDKLYNQDDALFDYIKSLNLKI